MMAVGLFGFGLCYLFVALLLSQCLSDSLSLSFVFIFVQALVLPLLMTEDMKVIGSDQPGNYYYFGYNFFFHDIHNFYIAYALTGILGLVYFLWDILRHSLYHRTLIKRCLLCSCCRLYQSPCEQPYLLIED